MNKMFITLPILLLTLLHYANGQSAFVLSQVTLYQPAITECVNADIYFGPYLNYTECGARSDGCVPGNLNCNLAAILGYPTAHPFMVFTPLTFSAAYPTTMDAKLNWTLTYGFPSIFAIQGFVQLWQKTGTDPVTGVDTYSFVNRQLFISELPGQTQVHSFNDITSGTYMLVYWDTGGTRFGTGNPETSLPFDVLYIFPAGLDLVVQIMNQKTDFGNPSGPCVMMNLGNGSSTRNFYIEYPFTKIFNFQASAGTNPYISYKLDGQFQHYDLTTYILNMEQVHHRKLVWEHRSDLGNIINVKTDPIPPTFGKVNCTYCNANVVMSDFCTGCVNGSYYGISIPGCASCSHVSPTYCSFCTTSIVGGFCQDESVAQIDSMQWFKIMPVTTGSYGEATGDPLVPDDLINGNQFGYFPWTLTDQGVKSQVSAKLIYSGIDNSEYEDYWRLRQGFGSSTSLGSRVLDMIQVDATSVWNYIPHSSLPFNGGTHHYVNGINTVFLNLFLYNHIEIPQIATPTVYNNAEDWLVTYFVPKIPGFFGYGGATGLMNMWTDYYNFQDQFRNNINWSSTNTNLFPDYYQTVNPSKLDATAEGHYCDAGVSNPTFCDILGGQMFKFKIKYTVHNNTDDYSCGPTGTSYANYYSTVQLDTDPSEFVNAYVNNTNNPTNYNHFTYADIVLGGDWAESAMTSCEEFICPGGYDYQGGGCFGILFASGGNALSLCCGSPVYYEPYSPASGPDDCIIGIVGLTGVRTFFFPNGGCTGGPPPNTAPSCCVYSDIQNPIIEVCSLPQCELCCERVSEIWTDRSHTNVLLPGLFPGLGNSLFNETTCGGANVQYAIYIGSSATCDVPVILNGGSFNAQHMPYFGSWNGDPSDNGEPYLLPTDDWPTPPFMTKYTYGALKDCSSGPFPLYYSNMYIKRALKSNVNPFFQGKWSYNSRQYYIDNEQHFAIFLAPSYVTTTTSNPIVNTMQQNALTLQYPPIPQVSKGLAGESSFSVGLDTHMVSIAYEEFVNAYEIAIPPVSPPIDYDIISNNCDPPFYTSHENCARNTMVWNTQTFASYARFLQYPNIIFRTFSNAIPQRGSIPALINVEFRVSCPFLQFNQYGTSSSPAYCAEGWYITNQASEAITYGVIQGCVLPDSDPLAQHVYATQLLSGPVPLQNQVLCGANDGDVFILTVAYQNLDVLNWVFNLRSAPEKPYGNVHGICTFDTSQERSVTRGINFYVPDIITVPVPPQEYVLLPMICAAELAAPACQYNTAEMLVFCVRGSFYAWEVIVALNLPQIGVGGELSGVGVNNQFIFYYYIWTLINQSSDGGNITIQGFGQQFQTYSPPFIVEVCDHIMCIFPQGFNSTPPQASVMPPITRPPRCNDQTINNATCQVNLEDSILYSGINQEPYCQNGVNSVLLTPRLICSPAYPNCQLLNIGSYFFYRTVEYIDPVEFALTHDGIYDHVNQFILNQITDPSGFVFVSLWVNYGLTLDSQFEGFCYDNILTSVYILSSFVVTPGTVQYLPGCSRADNCCYFLPLTVAGTSPYTGLPIILTGVSPPYNQVGNTTDLCFGAPACLYEVLLSPPLNSNGGVCLGTTYTFTVQTPHAIVESREGPPDVIGNNTYFNSTDFMYPYRCPATLTYTIPVGGFSPPTVITIPGPCNDPGTDATFSFQYTDPTCSGPISAANPVASCRRSLYFALANQNGNPAYPNSASGSGGGFSLTTPWLINGIYSFSYNTFGVFEFPQFFVPPLYPSGNFPPIPNGYWYAYFWVQAINTSATNGFNTVVDGRNKVQTNFLASLANLNGLAIIRTYLFRPQCPLSVLGPSPPINITFVITDLAWRGPYVVLFTDPVDQVIAQQNYTCGGMFCQYNCIDVDPDAQNADNPAETLSLCSLFISTIGITVPAHIGTGFQSPGYNGAYSLSVGAEGSACGSLYQEIMDALNPLVLQIECVPTTCNGGINGDVNTVVTGGTPIPFINQTQLLGSHFDVWIPSYYYNWTTPEGYLVTPSLLSIPEGNYSVKGMDWNGCNFTGSCKVSSNSSMMQLIPVGSQPPNCTGSVGAIQFRVVGGRPPYTLMKISNNTVAVGQGYAILEDPSVVPDTQTFYAVEDSNGCLSPEISFTLGGPIDFQVAATVQAFPCGTNTATGTICAMISPPGLGTVLTWTNVNTGQVVYTNADDFGNLCLNNVPAATYKLDAVAVLYGCVKTVYVSLIVRSPPVIMMDRFSISSCMDKILGNIISDNGPPYTVSFIGLTPNPPPTPPFLFTFFITFPAEQFTIINLFGTTSFTMVVVDPGQCRSTFFSQGRTCTQYDTFNTPSPIPGTHYNQTPSVTPAAIPHEHYNLKMEVVLLVVVAVSILSFVGVIAARGAFVYRGIRPKRQTGKNK